jgi:DNA-binding MarR family transcriptional regulator
MSAACLLAELHADGPLRQVELGRRLGLDRGNVSHAVSQLVRRGWVRRELATGDRRGVVVALTDQGDETANYLAEARRSRIAMLFSRIPADQHPCVLAVLVLMSRAAAGGGPRPGSPGR